jgi:hypothetical protein
MENQVCKIGQKMSDTCSHCLRFSEVNVLKVKEKVDVSFDSYVYILMCLF